MNKGMRVLSSTPFVGRGRETEQISALFKHGATGHGSVCFITGEPGIGKSRLAEEALECAASSGFCILTGRCTTDRTATAFYPWTEIVDALVQSVGSRAVAEWAGRYRGFLEGISPELESFAPHAGDRTPTTSSIQVTDSPQRQLVLGLKNLMENCTAGRPAVLYFDDIQWADGWTLETLRVIGRNLGRIPMVILCTYRSTAPDGDSKLKGIPTDLLQLDTTYTVPLVGLGQAETGLLLREIISDVATELSAHHIHRLTAGNPLLTSLYGRHIENGLSQQGVHVEVAAMVMARVSRLSASAQSLLVTASHIGDRFPFLLLASAAENVDGNAAEYLDELVGAGLLQIIGDAPLTVRFVHVLVREAVQSNAPIAKVFLAHQNIAEALQEVFPNKAERYSSDVLHHLLRTSEGKNNPAVRRVALMAGRRAFENHSFAEAIVYLRIGLELAGSDQRYKAACSDALARAYVHNDPHCRAYIQDAEIEFSESSHLFLHTIELYLSIGDIKSIKAFIRSPEIAQLGYSGRFTDIDTLERLVRAVPEDGHADLLLARAVHFGQRNRKKAERILKTAWRLSRRRGDALAQLRLGWMLATSMAYYGNHFRKKTLVYTRGAIKAAEKLSAFVTEVTVRDLEIAMLNRLGRDEMARERGREMLERAELSGDVAFMSIARVRDLTIRIKHTDVFDLDSALEDLKKIEDIGYSLDESIRDQIRRVACALALIGGDTSVVEATLNREVDLASANTTTYFEANLLRDYGFYTGDYSVTDTLEWMSRQWLEDKTIQLSPHFMSGSFVGLGFVALFRGDMGELQNRISPIDTAVGDQSVLYKGALYRGLGDYRNAIPLLKRALSQAHHKNPHAAVCRIVLGEALLARNRGRDRVRGTEFLLSGLELAAQIKAPLIKGLAIRYAGRHKIDTGISEIAAKPFTVAEPAGRPANLTKREMEVLTLIAVGKTNKEIGASLFISVRTVDRHMSSIFQKTRCGNRTEAARFAINHGIDHSESADMPLTPSQS